MIKIGILNFNFFKIIIDTIYVFSNAKFLNCKNNLILMKFTILGASGFIGKNLVKYLLDMGMEVYAPDIRNEDISKKNLGHVIYALDELNSKKNYSNVVESHICYLNDVLNYANFESLLYCSATRVYSGVSDTNENNSLTLNPTNSNNLYPISKIMGESICLAHNNPKIRIARLSNVSGMNHTSKLFLPTIIREAVDNQIIKLHTTLESEKDYVDINDVVKILLEISLHGKYRIYNIAQGNNTSNLEIITKIQEITSCKIEVLPDAHFYYFPTINIKRICDEFNFNPISILDYIDDIIKSYKIFTSKT